MSEPAPQFEDGHVLERTLRVLQVAPSAISSTHLGRKVVNLPHGPLNGRVTGELARVSQEMRSTKLTLTDGSQHVEFDVDPNEYVEFELRPNEENSWRQWKEARDAEPF